MKRWLIKGPIIFSLTAVMVMYQNCGGIGTAVRSISKASQPTDGGTKKENGEISPSELAPLNIIKQPHAKTAYVGDTITFQAIAKSDEGIPLKYQWKKNGKVIDGETASALVLTQVTMQNIGLYSVEISTDINELDANLKNKVIETSAAPLVVSETTLGEVFPQKISQTVSHEVAKGSPIVLELETFGKPQPSIQWYKNGSPIDGATRDFLVIEESDEADGGIYGAVISNQAGIKLSEPILVAIDQSAVAPIFVAKSPDQSVAIGQSVTLAIGAAGLPSPSYQWLKNGTVITNATSSSLTINSVAIDDGATYSVLVSNASGNFIENIQLSVIGSLSITSAPANQMVAAGQPASFSIVVDGMVDSYQWYKDDVLIMGATSSTLSIASTQTTDSGTYKVRVSNASGSLESSASLTVVTAPQITSAPTNVTIDAGNMASFSVTASGLALSYQWLKNGSPIAGQTNATLNIANAKETDSGTYSVNVTNIAGSASASAALTVNPVVINGATVYANNCAACHGTLAMSTKKMRTALQIQGAITNQAAMMGIILSSDELQALEAALNIP